jgi:hypothetical protein
MTWLSNAFEFTHDYQTKRSLLDRRRDDIEGSGPIWAGQINKELRNASRCCRRSSFWPWPRRRRSIGSVAPSGTP